MNKKVGKPVFFVVFVIIALFAYTTLMGVHSYYGDIRSTYIHGLEDIRLGIDIQGGVEFYDGNESEDGSSNDQTSFTYALGLNGKPTERLTIGIHGLGEYEPSEDIYGSSVDTKSIGLRASYRFFERLIASAGVTYRREEYERRISFKEAPNQNPYSVDDVNGRSRDDDTIELSGRLTYSLNNYASIYASITYQERSSSMEDFDYDRTRYGFGGILRY